MKVVATGEYVRLNVEDVELKRIPKEGEIFEVSDERFQVLNGKNAYNTVFVEKSKEFEEVDNILNSNKKNKKK